MTQLANAHNGQGYIREQFPPFPVLQAWLEDHFGHGFYTDDIDVIDVRTSRAVAEIVGIDSEGMTVNRFNDDGSDDKTVHLDYTKEC